MLKSNVQFKIMTWKWHKMIKFLHLHLVSSNWHPDVPTKVYTLMLINNMIKLAHDSKLLHRSGTKGILNF